MYPPFLLFEVNEQRVLDDREAGSEGNYPREVEQQVKLGEELYELT